MRLLRVIALMERRRTLKLVSKSLVLLLLLASMSPLPLRFHYCCCQTRAAKHVGDGLDEDDDDDLKFQLPQSTSGLKRMLFTFLHDKLKLPDVLLRAIFSLSIKVWAVIILWFILARVAHRWDIGPLYILGTGFAIIFINLGKQQHGDMSAYSIFNEDFRELPGTFNADGVDRDIRAGRPDLSDKWIIKFITEA